MFSMNVMPSVQADYCFLEQKEDALNERMRHMSDTFQQYLLYLIESRKAWMLCYLIHPFMNLMQLQEIRQGQ